MNENLRKKKQFFDLPERQSEKEREREIEKLIGLDNAEVSHIGAKGRSPSTLT